MAATGHLHTQDVSVKLETDGGDVALSAHGNTVDFEYNADDLEATAYGDVNHTFLQGLTVWSATYSGWWSGSHATDLTESVAACIHNIVGESSTCKPALWVAPAGSAAGSLCYVGCVNVQAAPMSFPADNIATMSLTFTARAGSLTACADSIWT